MTVELSNYQAELIAKLHQAVVTLMGAATVVNEAALTYDAKMAAWGILDKARCDLAMDLAMAVNPIALKFPQYWIPLSQQIEEVA